MYVTFVKKIIRGAPCWVEYFWGETVLLFLNPSCHETPETRNKLDKGKPGIKKNDPERFFLFKRLFSP
jgi:hypothetical protein